MDRSILDKIRSSVSLLELASQYTTLKRVGKNYRGLCPFHSEKTPSFFVSPDKNLFYCFGCHKGGDVFKFLEYAEGLEFGEALYRLAKLAGISLDFSKDRSYDRSRKRETILKILRRAMDFYREALWNDEKALSYLKQRGLSEDTIKRFNLGYAPSSGNFILEKLSFEFSYDDIKLSGLVSYSGDRDRFDDRVMFPILNIHGEIIGFGGRTISDGEPKYLNSPDTMVFKKNKVFYGFFESRDYIKEENEVFVVEGYFDYLLCFQSGIKNVVATMGTALSDEKMRYLVKYANTAYFLFDSDEAGLKAAFRAYEVVRDLPIEPKIIILPDGLDPADFFKNHTKEEFLRFKESAYDPISFKISQSLKGKDISNPKELNETLKNEIFPVIASLSPIEQEKYLKELYEEIKSHVDYSSLVSEFSIFLKKGRISTPQVKTRELEIKKVVKAEWDLLIDIIQNREYYNELMEPLKKEYFFGESTRFIYEYLLSHSDFEGPQEVIDALPKEEWKNYLTKRILEYDEERFSLEDFIERAAFIKVMYLDREIERIKSEIDSSSDSAGNGIELLGRYQELIREKQDTMSIFRNKSSI